MEECKLAKKLPLSILSTFTILSIYGNPNNEEAKEKKPSVFIEDEKKMFVLDEKSFTDYSFIVSDETEDYLPTNIIDVKYDIEHSVYDNAFESNLAFSDDNDIPETILFKTINLEETDDLYINRFEPWNLGAETDFSLEEDFFKQINAKKEENSEYQTRDFVIEDDPYSEGISNSYINYKETDVKDIGKLYLHKGVNGVFLMGNIDNGLILENSLKNSPLKLMISSENNDNEYEVILNNLNDREYNRNSFDQIDFVQEESVLNNLQEGLNFKMYIAYKDLGFDGDDEINLKLLSEDSK